MTSFDPLQIRKNLGRELWCAPIQFGPDGWMFDALGARLGNIGRIIVTAGNLNEEPLEVVDTEGNLIQRVGNGEDLEFIHASIARPAMPTYEDLVLLHKAVFPGFAYQVFAPVPSHINIHETALHLWGRADGKPWGIPDFGKWGTI